MGKRYERGIVVLRRDLRLDDNTALIEAANSCKEVLPCFIFNDQQLGKHPYFSPNGLAFLIESLESLISDAASRGGKFQVFHGDPALVIRKLIGATGAQAVFVNEDYTPFSQKRDKAMRDACLEAKAEFHTLTDLVLCNPRTFGKPDGKPYTVFTPFYKRAMQLPVARPQPLPRSVSWLTAAGIGEVEPRKFWPEGVADGRVSRGGREEAVKIVETLGSFAQYKAERDLIPLNATTKLSPHNKFGTVSIREVYWALCDRFGPGHDLIRQLFWRDFFTHIGAHFPHVFGGAFHRSYDRIQWRNDEMEFKKWCQGETGFPIVDAGIRELITTGFMHNRVRMIVASFLVKDLLVDWRWGEQFFARHLTEFDPAVNNGSWQWSASTGCDAQPYFRIFNPWLQQAKFDPEAEYIKRWVPELRQWSTKKIHGWADSGDDLFSSGSYPRPMLDHSERKVHAEEAFRSARG
jgi:deoxyribodipyrimidine photo-lyase